MKVTSKHVTAQLCLAAALAIYLGIAHTFLQDAGSSIPAQTESSPPPESIEIVSKPVYIETEPETTPMLLYTETEPETILEPSYTEEELEILALIIYQEAGADYCLDSTRQMVGEVFLNRVASSRYPDTFYEVATQRAQYGRLHWTGISWPERATRPQEQHAIKRAYDVAKDLLTENVKRLLPLDAIYQAEFEQGSETLAAQDGLYFCR